MKNDELRTHDLYFAAFLQASRVDLKRTEKEPNGRIAFVFQGEDIEELKAEWINRSGLINAQDFTQAIRTLKSLVHM